MSRRGEVGGVWPQVRKRDLDTARVLSARAVASALKDGRLVKVACQRCEVDAPQRYAVEAHHEDYGRPLDVAWLCRKHHRARHREIGGPIPQPNTFDDVRSHINKTTLISAQESKDLVERTTRMVLGEMERQSVSASELARRTGVSRQHVSTYFRGGIRTLKSLAVVGAALGCSVRVVLEPIKASDGEAKP